MLHKNQLQFFCTRRVFRYWLRYWICSVWLNLKLWGKDYSIKVLGKMVSHFWKKYIKSEFYKNCFQIYWSLFLLKEGHLIHYFTMIALHIPKFLTSLLRKHLTHWHFTLPRAEKFGWVFVTCLLWQVTVIKICRLVLRINGIQKVHIIQSIKWAPIIINPFFVWVISTHTGKLERRQ